MAVCANCDHLVDSHSLDGCDYSGQGRDSCNCPFDFYRANLNMKPERHPAMDTECRTCGHTRNWHSYSDDPVCSQCTVCDGFVHGQASWANECGLGHSHPSAAAWRCRRKAGHDYYHAEGADRWVNGVVISDQEVEGVEYEDAKPSVANPDRVKAADSQVGGEHYRQTGVQPWDVVDAWGLDFYAGNALKYLYRAGRKGARVEDLKKARHYIDKMIEKEES